MGKGQRMEIENDYIRRQAAIDELNYADDMGTIRSILDVLDVLRTLPSADVVPRSIFEQVKWERDVAMKQLEDLGIGFGEEVKDVVEVVRCRDCICWDTDGYCIDFMTQDENGYCYWGKRKTKMLTLEQNIRAVIETCFAESKEELQEIATQRIVELIDSNAPNTLEDDKNRWNDVEEVVPPDGDLVIITIHDDSGDTPIDYTTAGWHYKDAWFAESETQPMHSMVKAWKWFPKPYKGV